MGIKQQVKAGELTPAQGTKVLLESNAGSRYYGLIKESRTYKWLQNYKPVTKQAPTTQAKGKKGKRNA